MMNQYYITEASDIIPAPPEKVYAVLADYHTHHPAILPKPAFKSLKVLKGGTGAGTEIEASMNEWGRTKVYRLEVSEPEPGRVLREVDAQKGVETTFTVEPVDHGQSRVTITMKRQAGTGLVGVINKMINPPIIRMVFKTELKQLADYVT